MVKIFKQKYILPSLTDLVFGITPVFSNLTNGGTWISSLLPPLDSDLFPKKLLKVYLRY